MTVTIEPTPLITTRYIAPTDTDGEHVEARTMTGRFSITTAWDYSKNMEENHEQAVRALTHWLEWKGTWKGTNAPDHTPDAYVFMRTE